MVATDGRAPLSPTPLSRGRRWEWLRTVFIVGAGCGLLACSQGGAPQSQPKPKRDMRIWDDDDLGSETQDLSGWVRDLAGADLRGVDLRPPDDLSMPSDLRVPPDLSGPPRPPCKAGAGWAAFRFHYSGSTSASLDVLGLPDTSRFSANPGYSTSFTDGLHGGGIEIASGNFILILFSLSGLTRINSATLSVYGRSYNTGASGSFEGWSPIHGSISSPTNSVSNAWPYAWTSVDYTGNVDPSDSPGLTGIRLYARGSSNDLVINSVELCIDGF